MKNPFSTVRGSQGAYSPQVMESAHGLSSQETGEASQQSLASDSAMPLKDARADAIESSSDILKQHTFPLEAVVSREKGAKKFAWRRFFLKLLCLGPGESELDSEIYHSNSQVDKGVAQQDAVTTPSVGTQGITDDQVNAVPHDTEHSGSAGNSSKKRGILRRFFSKLLCLGSGDNESEVVDDHDAFNNFPYILSSLDSDISGTYVPFERCDEDISSIQVKGDTSSVDEVDTPSGLPSALDPTSQQPLKEDPSKLQPITQLKKQRPLSYSHISPATNMDENASHSAANRIRDTQTPSLLSDNPNDGVSLPKVRKNFKAHSTSDISTISGNVTLNTQGKLQQKNTSLPDLRSKYLLSEGTIDVPTNNAPLQKVGNVQDCSAIGKNPPIGTRSEGHILQSSHSSPLSIHEEHGQSSSIDSYADVRSAMRKINRSSCSEMSRNALLKKHVSFAEKISYAPCTARSDSSVSKIIRLFEERSGIASQNLHKDLPSMTRR